MLYTQGRKKNLGECVGGEKRHFAQNFAEILAPSTSLPVGQTVLSNKAGMWASRHIDGVQVLEMSEVDKPDTCNTRKRKLEQQAACPKI